MTRTVFALLIGAIYAAGAFAQSEPTTVILAGGTLLNAELNSSVDSKKAKAGDKVEAHTTADLRTDGRMVISKGTKLVGRITQAAARAKGDSESVLAIQFDKAVPKNGEEIPLNVEIRAIAAPQRDFYGGPAGPGSDPMAGRGGAAAGGSPMGSSHPVNPATPASDPADNPPGSVVQGSSSGGGPLPPNSRGVYDLNGLQLAPDPSKANAGTIVTSTGKTVRLDGGTRLLLVVRAKTPALDAK
jgi:hypothetical protein